MTELVFVCDIANKRAANRMTQAERVNRYEAIWAAIPEGGITLLDLARAVGMKCTGNLESVLVGMDQNGYMTCEDRGRIYRFQRRYGQIRKGSR